MRKLYVIGGLIMLLTLFGMKKLYARGVRNNNPGNLRLGAGYTWLGQVGIDKGAQGSYVIFDTPQHGLRAAAITAWHYFSRFGIRTLRQFGNRWAPASDNSGESDYGAKLATQLGISPDIAFDYSRRMPELLHAIIHNEGNQAVYLTLSLPDFTLATSQAQQAA